MRENLLGCVSRNWVIVGREEQYVLQLVGTRPNDYGSQEDLEEIVMVQVEIIARSSLRARVCFFQKRDVDNCRLSGRWMYYCLFWLLVLTSGRVLLAEDRHRQRLGVSRIICRMLDLVNIEFTRAGLLGHMYARVCLYHHEL